MKKIIDTIQIFSVYLIVVLSVIYLFWADNTFLSGKYSWLRFIITPIVIYAVYEILFKNRNNNKSKFIEIELPDGLKNLFIDSLLAFENYSTLLGYKIKFSFDNSENDKLGFNFTVLRNPDNISKDEIRADIKEFLEKIQRGEEIKDIPVLINEIEHIKVLTILNNKLSTIRHNAYLEKNLNSGIEHIVKKVIEEKGFIQSINIHNHMGENKEIKATNSNVNMGENNLIEDNSINIHHSFNEKKTIIEKINQSITHINNEASLSPDEKEELKRHLGNIKDEIEEAQPNPSLLKKAWDKIKKIVEGVKLGKDLLEHLKSIAVLFNVDFPS